MKKIILIAIAGLFVLTAKSYAMAGDNYDDIGGFFEYFARQYSPKVQYTHITKAMIKHALPNDLHGISAEKIDFVKRVIVADDTNTSKGVVELATTHAEKNGFTKLVQTDTSGGDEYRRNYLFVKYGEGGLCSILAISIYFKPALNSSSVIAKWMATLIGGTFAVDEISDIYMNE